MVRLILCVVASISLLTACGNEIPKMGPDGKPLPKLYRLSQQSSADVQFRILDSVNALRASAKSPTLVLNASLMQLLQRMRVTCLRKTGLGISDLTDRRRLIVLRVPGTNIN